MTQQLALSIVGSGGDGAVAAGDILAMACARDGLNVIKTEAYGPQIRGGESSCTVRISAKPIFAQADALDALVVFNWEDFSRFRAELVLSPNAVILHEADDPVPDEIASVTTRRIRPVAFANLAREAGAPSGKNIFALGLLASIFGLPADAIRAAIVKRFAKKTAAVLEGNRNAFDKGFALGAELGMDAKKLAYTVTASKLLMSGNEASAVGAVDAGCRFFAGYPITPSSEILHFMAEWLPKIGGSCLQTEDELAAFNAVIGGSFAGVKSMTSTSGPGLSLMSESIGLASIAEVPAVIVNVQRGGPSTGIPTKSEQSDLLHSVFGSHGDTPRVVLAPTDVEDSFHITVDAFNIAEEFQIPTIVLSDQSIAQRRETLSRESLIHDVTTRKIATPEQLENFRRYAITEDGVSPMSVPGMASGMYQTNGLEHDERGRPSSMYVVHERMNEKRYRKLDAIRKSYKLYRRFGAEKPQLGILCWGSSTGPVREAIDIVSAQGVSVAAFVPRILMPLPAADIQQFVDSCSELLVIELSHSAQFYQYLRTEIDFPRARTRVHARSGGKALSVTEIVEEIRRSLAGAEKAEEVLA